MAGRPTKLTDDVSREICNGLRLGLYPDQAAGAAGVGRSTYYLWIQTAEEELESRAEGNGADTSKDIYVAFLDATQRALADAESDALRTLKEGEQGWQAQAWVLERRWRDRWGRTTKTEITGADGGPLKVEASVEVTDLLALADELSGGYDPADEDGGSGDGDAAAGV